MIRIRILVVGLLSLLATLAIGQVRSGAEPGQPHPPVPIVIIEEDGPVKDLGRGVGYGALAVIRPAGFDTGVSVDLAALLGLDDAVSRELSVWQRPTESGFVDAVSRELSVWQRPVEGSFTDAVSRELSVWQRPVESGFVDAVSRELSVWQRPVESIITDANSRELSVYATAGAGVIYVKGDTGNDANDGSSWALAKKTLQAAFDAGGEGTEYWVARGTYTSSPLLKLVHSGSIYGGFAGTESAKSERVPGTNITTISGGNVDRALTVNIGGSLILDTLTFSNGVPPNGFGGGVYFGGKGLVVESCTFSNNSAGANFGGALFHEGTNLVIRSSTIRSNSALRGGGVYVKTGKSEFTGCVFSENKATAVGSGYAAALYLASPGEALVNRCWFNDNVGDRGGTVDIFPSNTPATITNSVFLRNSGDRGSAILNSSGTVAVVNCSFLDNSSAGPAVLMENVNPNVVSNSIFYRNGGGVQMPVGTVVANCMFGNILFDYADIGDQTGVNGNIKADPNFVTGYAAHIRPNSPCRNSGSHMFGGGFDIDGQNRVEGIAPDMGADESYGEYPGRVIYIRTDGNDSSSGLSWGSAKKTLSGAIQTAQTGDEIWIAKGTYSEQNLNITVGVSIYGGFVGNETDRNQANPGLNVTAFDGKGTARILRMVNQPFDLVLDGLTIMNGYGQTGGGGIAITRFTYNTTSRISRCVFRNNTTAFNANYAGGGLYAFYGRLFVSDCTFTANGSGSGGALLLSSLSRASVERCVFSGNQQLYASGGWGSAIGASGARDVVIEQCVFNGNVVTNGGTVAALFGSSPVELRNSVFASNNGLYAGAIWSDSASSLIVNNTITGGTAAQAVLLPNPAGTHFVNNIVTGTSGGLQVANGTLASVRNNCVWQNGAFDYSGMSDPTGQNGNVRVDPQVVNDTRRHIKPTSPVRNAGDNAFSVGFDIDGQSRKEGTTVDIGADESYGENRSGGIIYVRTNGNDTLDGLTWTTAKKTLAAAHTIAADGDEIWMAQGTYAPTSTLTISKAISVYGGFVGNETAREQADPVANLTKVDGLNQRRLFYTFNFAKSLTFDGLWFVNANTSGDGGVLMEDDGVGTAVVTFKRCTFDNNRARSGAAMFNDGGKLVVEGCTFTKNSATTVGGAIGTWASNNEIRSCKFESNTASTEGGAVYVLQAGAKLESSTLSKNLAQRGGALISYQSNTTVSGCSFTGNESTDTQTWGSAIDLETPTSSTIDRCVFTENKQADDGATIVSWGGTSTVIRNSVLKSSLGPFGSAVFSNTNGFQLLNSTVVGGNSLSAVLIADYGSSAVLANNIVAFSKGGIEANAQPTLRNNCVWSNSSYDYKGFADPTGSNGNIRANPLLALDERMHIQPNSPCREGGNNTYASGLDIDGQARIQGSLVDIGADESDGSSWGGGTGRIIHVLTTGSDANDGLSWGTAKRTIGAALAAVSPLDEIWIKQGTYTESRLVANVGVGIYGGFDGTETDRSQAKPDINVTIIDGGMQGRILEVPASATTGIVTVDGLTLRRGSAAQGGAIHFLASQLTVSRCVISKCEAPTGLGGGIYFGGATLNVSDTTFEHNGAEVGGGLHIETGTAEVKDCLFLDNRQAGLDALEYGSAIMVRSSGTVMLDGNRFDSNLAYRRGTVAKVVGSGDLLASNNLFIGNETPNAGAIIVESGSYSIIGNTAIGNNSGSAFELYRPGVIANNLVAYNDAGIYVAQQIPTFFNNCVWKNRNYDYGGGVGDQTGSNGNVRFDPRLTFDGKGHITESSPCRDAGSNQYAIGLDIDRQSRIFGSHVDIGADEHQGETYPPLEIRDTFVQNDSGRNDGYSMEWAPIEFSTTGSAFWRSKTMGTYHRFTKDAEGEFAAAHNNEPVTTAFAPLSLEPYSVSASIWHGGTNFPGGIGFFRMPAGSSLMDPDFAALVLRVWADGNFQVGGSTAGGNFEVYAAGQVSSVGWDRTNMPTLQLTWDPTTNLVKAVVDGNVVYSATSSADPYRCRYVGFVSQSQNVALDNFRYGPADTTAPETTITSGPNDGQTVCTDQATFVWTGSDDKTQNQDLKYSFRIDSGFWSSYSGDKTTSYSGLADGPHTFEVRTRDHDGNFDLSPAKRSFTVDNRPPTIADVASVTGLTSATVTWKTDEPATSQVEYGETESYGNQTDKDQTLRTNHSVTIQGLKLNTIYHFRVRSSDSCGHEALSIDQTFKTTDDVTPPETTITVSPPNGLACTSPIRFEWKGTDDFSSSDKLLFSHRFDNGEWSDYSSDLQLDEGGVTDGAHMFEVRAKDERGNVDATPAKVSFTLDRTPPQISNIQAVATEDDVEVTWKTDGPSTSQVEYRLDGGQWQSSPKDGNQVTDHRVLLKDLLPGAYTYRVRSADQCDRESVEDGGAFEIHLPDLVVTQIVPPQAAKTDTPFFIKWTDKNQGSVKAKGPWTDSVYFSADNQIGNDTLLSSFIYPIDLSAGQSADREQSISIPDSLVPEDGTYYLVVAADSTDTVEEGPNDVNNALIVPIQVTKLPLADLTVTAITAPTSAKFGTDVTIDIDVKNIGQTSTDATAWFDRIALVQDNNVLVTSDRLNLAYLEPGQAYRATFTIRVPKGIVGACQLRATTDSGLVVRELSETNNILERGITIEPADAPDLAAMDVSGSEFVTHGQAMPISWTVRNIGETRTPPDESNWQDAVYLSADEVLSGDDIQLDSVKNLSGLLEGQSYRQTDRPSVVPYWVKPGVYHLFVRTDTNGNVFEFGREANNVSMATRTVTVLGTSADLWAEWLPDNPTVGIAGESVTLKFRVTNDGPDIALGSWLDRIILSKDNELDSEDTVIYAASASNLAVDASYESGGNVHLPLVQAGRYYLFAITDATDTIFESGSEDNNIATPIPIDIKADAPNLVTLDVTNPTAAKNGEQVRVNWTVKNTGIRPTNGNWYDQVYLSRDAQLSADDVGIGSFERTKNLAPDEAYKRAELCTVPITAAGQYFVIVKCDADQRVYENGAEQDNVAVGLGIQIQNIAPDLVVTASSAPNAVQIGETFEFRWSGANQGVADIAVGGWNDYVYLSDNDQLDAGDRFLASQYRSAPLVIGGSYDASAALTIPYVAEGNYFLLAVADASGSIFEGANEGNNVRARAIAVSLAKVDLVAESLQAPDEAVAGQTMAVNWNVRNNGPERTRQVQWSDQIVLSRDKVLDATDLRIANIDHFGALDSGAGYLQPANVMVPGGLNGTYYAFLIADIGGAVPETSESNNVVVSTAINISLPPPVDLKPISASLSNQVELGVDATWQYEVQNIGQNTAQGSWNDTLYLSLDDKWDIDDVLLGRIDVSETVVPGAKYSKSLTAPVPAVQPGEYHLLVRTNARNTLRESDRSNNDLAVLPKVTVTIEKLELGKPKQITLQQGRDRYYQTLDVPSGETLRYSIDVNDPQSEASTELFVRANEIVRRSQFDFGYERPWEADQQVFIPDSVAGIYYSLFGAPFVASPEAATVLAEIVPFSVRQASPTVVGDRGRFTILVRGGKLDRLIGATLRDGTSSLPASRIEILNRSEARLVFESNGLRLGAYDLEVQSNDGKTHNSPDLITVEPARVSIQVSWDSDAAPRQGRPDLTYAVVRNDGNIDWPYAQVRVMTGRSTQLAVDGPAKKILAPNSVKGSIATVLSSTYSDSSRALVAFRDLAPGEIVPLTIRIKDLGPDPFFLRLDVAPQEIDVRIAGFAADVEALRQAILLGTVSADSELTSLATNPPDFFAKARQSVIDAGYFTTADFSFSWPQGPAADLFWKVVTEDPNRLSTMHDVHQAAANAGPGGFGATLASESGRGTLNAYQGPQTNKVPRPAIDPNGKGGTGTGSNRHYSRNKPLVYTVEFENVSTAQGTASRVELTDVLPPEIDPRSITFLNVNFGKYDIQIPSGRSSYQTRIQLGPELGNLLADISCFVDVPTATVKIILQAIDPQTGEPPNSSLVGLLPPEDGTGRGRGSGSFQAKPKKGVVTSSVTDNQAKIRFDNEKDLDTNTFSSIVDSGAPTSVAVAGTASGGAFRINWSGQDDEGGIGVESYDVYVAEGDGSYKLWLARTSLTSAVFEGKTGLLYRVYTRARDGVGNIEDAPNQPDAIVDTSTGGPDPFRTPVISSVEPAFVVEGSPSFTLVVKGRNFAGDAKVYWNGVSRPVTWVSARELRVDISETLVEFPGFASIIVENPNNGNPKRTLPVQFEIRSK